MDDGRALDHAWKYFHLHAQQRITVFNFYVVFSGLLITGIAKAFENFPMNSITTAALGLILAGLSFLFFKLDQRVSDLIKKAERVIATYEPVDAKLVSSTKDAAPNGHWTYGKVFRAMFSVMGALGCIVVLVSLYGLCLNGTGGSVETAERGFEDSTPP
ncbi:hypothetical protein GCM10007315_13600 [Gemmobacter tilapiae]|uniref:Uncharacterized protein n=2 Tax=Neogemmobacter tilapiae TaxID=875041 RepID=A0A918TNA6_9RHOB|nr:hypothetical protein GCM10007315_13600 [Gemmobacter tilapiae]